VVVLRAAAQAGPPDAVAPWEQALAAADGALRLAATVEAPATLSDRARELRGQIAADAQRAAAESARRAADRAMVERLDENRGTEKDPDHSTSEEFAAAFADYGIDFATLAPDEARARVLASAIRVELALALDYWADIDDSRSSLLRPIAREADPDPWRTRLRDTERGPALRELAATADAANVPEASLIALVYALLRDGSLDVALEVAGRAARASPDNFSLQIQLADVHASFEPARVEEALRHASIAVALRPDSWDAWRRTALLHAERDDAAEAAHGFERCVALRPRHAYSRLNLALTLSALDRNAEALEHCDVALSLQPKWAKVLLVKGTAQRQLGDTAAAIETLEQALRAFVAARGTAGLADQARCRSQLALAFLAAGRHDDATAQSDQAIAIDAGGRSVRAWQARGLLALRRGDLAGARESLARAATLEPTDADVRFAQSLVERRAGDLPAAIAALREAAARAPKEAALRRRLGQCLHEAGDLDAAIGELSQATQLAPKDRAAAHALGIALRDRGRLRESLEALRRGGDSAAIKDGERLLALEPRLSEALRPENAPIDAAAWLDLARLTRIRRLHVAASNAFARAFSAAPSLADDSSQGLRLAAARSAAQVAAGRADDGTALDASARAIWRAQALQWLRDDLVLAREQIETGSDAEIESTASAVALLRSDRELEPLRNQGALQALAAESREEWTALWQEVDDLAGRFAGQ
jgi:Tfp pilus assembly protein PilF